MPKGEIVLKRIVMVLMAMMIMLTGSTVFAKSAAWMQEGYDFTAPQAALIDSLNYVPNKTDTVTPDEIYGALMSEVKESLFIKTRDASQYKAVLVEKNVNLDVLGKREAKQAYAENMKGYVDIRVVPTLVSKQKSALFVEVFDVATNKLVYSNQYKDDDASIEAYQSMMREFCNDFNKVMKRDKFKKKK
jgi:hypothetical protein